MRPQGGDLDHSGDARGHVSRDPKCRATHVAGADGRVPTGRTARSFVPRHSAGSRDSSPGSDAAEEEKYSGTVPELVPIGSFNSLSSRSSSDGEDPSSTWAPRRVASESCFDSLQRAEGQGDIPRDETQEEELAASSRKAAEARESVSPHEQVAVPGHWSERQRQLAIEGPFARSLPSLTEFLWWTGVRARSLFVLWLIYCAQYYVSFGLILPLLVLQRQHAALVYCAFAAAYSFVAFRNPERHGKKASPRFQKRFGSFMEEISALHFGGLRIIRDSTECLNPQERYIFGYHPHGNLPAILAWLPFTQAWRGLFPCIHPVGLVASAIFKVPVIRDLCLRAGIRDVSRRTFISTLQERGAVIMCPGGQAEIATNKHSSKKELVLSARKTGFIQIAIENGAKLVPILIFGESQLLNNIFYLPKTQNMTYKICGFPFPFFPLGFLGCLPIPKSGPVVAVVGEPFNPGNCISSPEAGPQDLERARVAYYGEVTRLFEKYKDRLGYGDWKLQLLQ